MACKSGETLELSPLKSLNFCYCLNKYRLPKNKYPFSCHLLLNGSYSSCFSLCILVFPFVVSLGLLNCTPQLLFSFFKSVSLYRLKIFWLQYCLFITIFGLFWFHQKVHYVCIFPFRRI